jgi:Glycosyl hydrolases family 39/Abnormal spindle-like microcephaly-assoc'd, ASPM-SPD-2-Hydin
VKIDLRCLGSLIAIVLMGYASRMEAQSISFSPKSIGFPNQGLNTTSAAVPVTLLNNQSGTLTISSIQISAPFAETDNCGTSLAPNAQCTLNVTFAPTAKQYYSSSLVITDSAGNSPQSVALSGNGVIPVTFSPAGVSFGNQAAGTTSITKNVTMSNNLPAVLSISGIQATAPFAQTNNCGTSLPGGGTCTLSLTFSPTVVQYSSSSITITDSATNSPQTVAVTGTGIAPVNYTPKTIAFPNQPANSTSAASVVTVTNNETIPLNIASIAAAAPFAATNNCGTTLAAGQSCSVNVTFAPTAAKYYTANLTIADDSATSPHTVALSGNGYLPLVTSPTQISFPNQATGTTSSGYTVTLTNKQPVTLNIASIAAPSPFAQTNNCGATLASGASCTVTVTFAPTASQHYSSALTITDDAATSPQTVPLNGTGYALVYFTPSVISFPSQAIGTSSAPSSVTLTNNQTVALNISGIAVPAPFSQNNNCGSSLGAGQTCTVSVTFSPTAVQYYASNVTATDSASNSPQLLPVNGNGTVGLTYVPKVGGLYFNNQIVQTSSTSQAVTLTNNQTTAVSFSSIVSSADYPFTTNCGNGAGGGTLAAGASCTVMVSFDPQVIGSRPSNLIINESAAGSPITIPLQGTGINGTQGALVAITPLTPCAQPLQTLQFTARTQNLSNPAVNWYVNNVPGGNSTVGTISSTGLYTAPAAAGTYYIEITSQQQPSLTSSATVIVEPAASLTYEIFPYVSSIPVGGKQPFSAQVCLVPDSNVTYTVDNIAGGNGTVGTVSSTGLYTAPPTAGKHTVRVTDASLNRTSGAVVTVFSSITADYGSRAGTTVPIPADLFGYGRGESIPTVSARNLLGAGGLTVARTSAQIATVYATQTPDWTKIDPLIATIKASGQHALLQMHQTPSWLQPTTGSCAGNVFAAPTDVNQWAQIAAAYVAHMDTAFPGVVTDYEIGNEPNATGMCSTATHLNVYLAIYAAAAPAMKAQAAQDGVTVRIGGPVISGYTSYWINALLTTSTTAPYVDFVSYHQYFYGSSQLEAAWDKYTDMPSMYEAEQDVSTGAQANYVKAVKAVAAGQQPNAATTPIYVTEYNTNWAFYQDCCRNDNTYAPVFNALYTTDMLNSVYNGVTRMPNKLFYFAGSAYPYFCLIGVVDSNNDCLYSAGATPAPYPQYFPYQLIASPQYLGLSQGGYMAKSISAPTGGGGLATTAFYTANHDAFVITNPTSTAYNQITVTLANPGLAGTQGTLYQIVNGAQISSTPISFSQSGTSLTTTISVPAYSVQAISLP